MKSSISHHAKPFDIEKYELDGFCELGRRLTDEQIASINSLFDELDKKASISTDWEAQYDSKKGVHRLRKLRRLIWNRPELFAPLLHSTGVLDIAETVIGPTANIIFHAAFLKPARIGTAVGLHQDQALWDYEYPKAFSVWFALTEVNPKNGGLAGRPKSHCTELEHFEDPDHTWHPTLHRSEHLLTDSHEFELQAGEAVMWDRFFAHSSGPNLSDQDRRGMVLVFADAGAEGFRSKDRLSLKEIRLLAKRVR